MAWCLEAPSKRRCSPTKTGVSALFNDCWWGARRESKIWVGIEQLCAFELKNWPWIAQWEEEALTDWLLNRGLGRVVEFTKGLADLPVLSSA